MTKTSKLFWIVATLGALALSATKCRSENLAAATAAHTHGGGNAKSLPAGNSGNRESICVERLASAIYRAEGGAKARVPYGVLSVKVKDEAEARKVCVNSIRNNLKRFAKTGKPYSDEAFICFMADRWCPIAADPVGNRNWKNNVTKIYGQIQASNR